MAGIFSKAFGKTPHTEPLKGGIRARTPSDVPRTTAFERIGCGSTNKGVTRAWMKLVAAFKAGNAPSISGQPVRFSLVSYGEVGGPSRFCLHEDDLPLLAQAGGIVEPAPKGWLSRDRFAEAIGCYPYHPRFKELWDRLKSACEAHGSAVDDDGREVRMRHYRLHARVALCIHVSEGSWFERKASLTDRLKRPEYRAWTPGWYARDDVGRAIDATPTTAFFVELWEEVRAIAQGPGRGMVRGRSVRATMLSRTTTVTAYLHGDSLEAFRQAHAEVKEERKETFREARRISATAARKIWSSKARLNRNGRDVAFAITRTEFGSRVDEVRAGEGQSPRVVGGHGAVRTAVSSRWRALAGRLDESSLWEHQKEAVRAFADHIGNLGSDPQGICVIPPGGGKTEIFANLVDAAMAEDGHGTPNAVILVPTQQMVEQTLTRLRDGFPGLSPGAMSSYHGGDVRPLTVMTYSGFAWAVEEGVLEPNDVDLLVLDECHRALSDIRQDVFGRFVGNTVVIAFSATPAFDTSKNVYALLGARNALVDVAIGRLIAAGVLAPIDNYIVCVVLEGTMPEGRTARAEVIRMATAAAALDVRNNFLDETSESILSDRRFVAFTKDRAHNAICVQAFLSSGHRVRELSGRDSLARQVGTLAALQRGEIDGIFNARLLIEGTDLPKVGAVLNVAHTDSLVVEIQRSGRAIRLDPDLPADDPRQRAMIFDFYVEHDGVILGTPRFFFETVVGEIPVRLVSGTRYDMDGLLHGKPSTGVPDGPPPVVRGDRGLVTVRAETRAIHRLLDRRDGKHDYRTAEWLPRTHVMAALRMTYKNPRFEAGWSHLEEARSGSVSVVDGREFMFALKRVVSGDVLCLHRDELDAFAELVATDRNAPPATKDRLGKIDAMNVLRTSHQNSPFARLWEEIREAHRKGPPFLVRGQELDLRMVRGRVWTYLTVADRDLPWIRQACGLGVAEPMSSDWLGWSEIRTLLEGRKGSVRIMEVWDAVKTAAALGQSEVVLDGSKIGVGLIERKGRVVAAIRSDSLESLMAVVGPDLAQVPDKTPEWLAKVEVAKVLKVSPQTGVIERVFGDLIPADMTEGALKLRSGSIRVSLMRSRSKRIQCIHRDGIAALRRHLAIPGPAGASWIARTRAGVVLRATGNPRFVKLWEELVRCSDAGEVPLVEGRPIRFEIRKTRPTACFHVHVDDLPILAAGAGITLPGSEGAANPWQEGCLGRNKTAKALGTHADNGPFRRLWDEIAAIDGNVGLVRGIAVRVERMRHHARTSLYVHEDALPDLRREMEC